MSVNATADAPRKTPADTTPFERNQLRFFLSRGNLATTLSEVNPSLAWLPFLWEAKLVESETQLVSWIEKNFFSDAAVSDVAANINFFGPDTASFLEYRLNAQAPSLPSLLAKCWALILKHMRSTKRGLAQNEWFQIAPRIKHGDHSADLLERLSHALRPKLKIGKRISWYQTDEGKPPQKPTDLMSIDYEVVDGLVSRDVIETWPVTASAATDGQLLLRLTTALNAALSDATEAGVERNDGYSISDTDVPSVERHRQNEYRSGFQTIIRVMAEVWTRLASKSPERAREIAALWRGSQYRLTKRLALFAYADPAMRGTDGADALIDLSSAELFLESSSVEAYRLMRTRWKDFPARKRTKIVDRLCSGPPRNRFRKGSEAARYIDRSRYDFLKDMVLQGINIGPKAAKILKEIEQRWPAWQPRPSEQIGFHVWLESGSRERPSKVAPFANIPDDGLVAEAKKLAATSSRMDDDFWHDLCLTDPDRALRGLAVAASIGDWPSEFWRRLLWSHKNYADAETEERIANLLLQYPVGDFAEVYEAASSWLDAHDKTLSKTVLWQLWDRIADAALANEQGEQVE